MPFHLLYLLRSAAPGPHSGWYARVLQHEYDHLKGVLFIDYLGAFR
ncbi:MAG: peptide deformylase, partial [Bacillota bacterium]